MKVRGSADVHLWEGIKVYSFNVGTVVYSFINSKIASVEVATEYPELESVA